LPYSKRGGNTESFSSWTTWAENGQGNVDIRQFSGRIWFQATKAVRDEAFASFELSFLASFGTRGEDICLREKPFWLSKRFPIDQAFQMEMDYYDNIVFDN
jgi:hypothetical protein